MKVESHDIVWIKLNDEKGKESSLITEFLIWSRTQNIYPAMSSGCGPWFYHAGYYKKDAEKIFKWLKNKKIRVPGCYTEWGDEK